MPNQYVDSLITNVSSPAELVGLLPIGECLMIPVEGDPVLVDRKEVTFENKWNGYFETAQYIPIRIFKNEVGFWKHFLLCDENGVSNQRRKNRRASDIFWSCIEGDNLYGPVVVGELVLEE